MKTLYSLLATVALVFLANFAQADDLTCSMTSGGSISGPSSVCAGENFTLHNQQEAQTNGSPTYAWIVSLDGATWNSDEIVYTDSPNFTTTITQPTWFRRCAIPQGCGWSWNNSYESNWVEVHPQDCACMLGDIVVYDGATNQPAVGIPSLEEGVAIEWAALPTNFYLVAETMGSVESVVITVNGTTLNTENYPPYTYPGGGENGSFWNAGAGDYHIVATAYSDNYASGNICGAIDFNFEIVETPCELTIENDGDCPIDIFRWVPTGDEYVATLQPNGSVIVNTSVGQMWRAVAPNWNISEFDEHTTVAFCGDTWVLNPEYCEAPCVLAVDAGPNQTICEGEAVQLTATATGVSTCEDCVTLNDSYEIGLDIWNYDTNGLICYEYSSSTTQSGYSDIVTFEDPIGNSAKQITTIYATFNVAACFGLADDYSYPIELNGSVIGYFNPTELPCEYNVCETNPYVTFPINPANLNYNYNGTNTLDLNFDTQGAHICVANVHLTFDTEEIVCTDVPSEVTYLWNTGESTQSIMVSEGGTYTVSIIDCEGCDASDDVHVNILEVPEAEVSFTNPNCVADNGTITFTFPDNPSRTNIEFSIDGGLTFPYNFSDNIGSATISNLGAGSYSIFVRWGNDECATDLGITIVLEIEGCSLFGNPVLSSMPMDITVECDNVPAAEVITATDLCGDPVPVTFNESQTTGCAYTITRTWTAINICGNTTELTQTITVEDTTAPTVSNPPMDLDLECGADAPAYEPMWSDNCDMDLVFTAISAIAIIDNCTVQVQETYSAEDDCGNVGSVSRTITYTDTTAPVLSAMPADTTVECDAVPAAEVLTATDICSGDVDVAFSESQTDGCPYTITRTWTATDDCGLVTSYTQTITVEDTMEPTVSNPPMDLELECGAEAPAYEPMWSDNCDMDLTFTAISAIAIIDDCTTQVQETYSAEDDCGNVGSVSRTITYTDTTAPVLSAMPADTTVECDAVPAAEVLTATDVCSGDLEVAFSESQTDGCPYTITRTWTATDDCGLVTSYTQTITVEDTEAPTVSNEPMDLALECGADTPAYEPMWSDNCDMDLTFTAISAIAIIDDCTTQVQETYSAEDDCGNVGSVSRTITYTDTTAPVLSAMPADTTVECDAVPAAEVLTATDICSGDVDVAFSESQTDGCPYTITRTWTATDDCGLVTSYTQTITVEDTTAPTVSNEPMDLALECGADAPAYEPMWSDNCDMDLVFTAISAIAIIDNCTTQVQETYSAEDDCGNVGSVSRTITYTDTTAPVLSAMPEDTTVECDAVPAAEVLTATDICSGDVEVAFSEVQTVGCPYTIARTWTATDDCGLETSYTQTITVDDTIPPIITGPLALEEPCDNMGMPMFEVSDNCDLNVVVVVEEEMVSTTGCAGVVIRSITATDDCGNVSMLEQIVTLIDTTAPTVSNEPMDLALECGADAPAYEPMWSDNCDMDLVFTAISAIAIIDDCTTQVQETYSAQDDCGNVGSVSRTITYTDTTAPVLSAMPANTTVECDAVPAAEVLTATDVCSGDVEVAFSESQTDGCPYTITRTWTATDDCGLVTSYTQTISVEDTLAPTVSNEPMDLELECGAEAPAYEPVWSDNCDMDLVFTAISAIAIIDNCTTQVQETYSAEDDCGNVGSVSRTITYTDTTAPVLSAMPADTTVECDAVPAAEVLTATDICSGDVDVAFSESQTDGCSFTITRTWTATDDCGLETSYTQTITVDDTMEPTVSNEPMDLALECGAEAPAYEPVWSDNCDMDLVFTAISAIAIIDNCTTQVQETYSAEDDCGNVGSVSRTITYTDTQAPEIEVPAMNMTVECDGNGNAEALEAWISSNGNAVASDDCTGDVTWSSSCDTPTQRLEIDCLNEADQVLSTIAYGEPTGADAFGYPTYEGKIAAFPSISLPLFYNHDLGRWEGYQEDTFFLWFAETTAQLPPCETAAWQSVPGTGCAMLDVRCTEEISECAISEGCGSTGDLTVVFFATDQCGNTAQTIATFTIIDTAGPTLEEPAMDMTVECDGQGNITELEAWVASQGGAIASDACSELVWTNSCTSDIQGIEMDCFNANGTPLGTIIYGNPVSFDENGFPVYSGTVPGFPALTYPLFYDHDLGQWQGYQDFALVWTNTTSAQTPPCDGATWETTGATQCETLEVRCSTDSTFCAIEAECGATGSVTVTFNATDECGNSTPTTATFTVEDTMAPTVSNEPMDLALECGAEAPAYEPMWSDNCDMDLAFTAISAIAILDNCTTQVQETYSAEDDCGNVGSVSRTITYTDTQAPEIEVPAMDMTVECDGNGNAEALEAWISSNGNAVATDECSGEVTWSSSCDTPTQRLEIDCLNETDQVLSTIAYGEPTGADAFGYPTYVGKIAAFPSISLPLFYNHDLGRWEGYQEDTFFLWFAETTAQLPPCETEAWQSVPGTGCAMIEVRCSEEISECAISEGCGSTGDVTVVFFATDQCGNTAQTIATFTIIDTAGPTLEEPAMDMTVECDGQGNVTELEAWVASQGGAIASDACSELVWTNSCTSDIQGIEMDCFNANGTPLGTIIYGNPVSFDENGFPVYSGTVLGFPALTYPLFYDHDLGQWQGYQDFALVWTNTTSAQTPPCDGATWETTGATQCETLEVRCSTDSTFCAIEAECGATGSVTVTFNATDECGNSTPTTATFTVEDTMEPTVSNPPMDLDLECGAEAPAYEPMWSDNCDMDLALTAISAIAILDNCTTQVQETYSAQDDCGNVGSVSRTITYTDTTAPVLSAMPADTTVECDAVPAAEVLTATDVCSGDVEVVFSESQTEGCPYTITRTWTATDDCGLVTSYTQTISVDDTMEPTVSNEPMDLALECGTEAPAYEPMWSDNCDMDLVFTAISAIAIIDNCTTQVQETYSAEDDCGNVGSVSRTITYTDTTAPVLSAMPADTTVECDAVPVAEVLTATDICSGDVEVAFSESQTDGCPYTITRTWTATDDCGLVTSYTQTITVEDTEAPVLTGPTALEEPCDNMGMPQFEVSDNCDLDPTVDIQEDIVSTTSCGGVVIRTITATDNCGNSATLEQIVTLIDLTPPVLVSGPADQALECGAVLPTEEPIFSENCSVATLSDPIETLTPGNCPGNYEVSLTWTASDDCENVSEPFTVVYTFQDSTPPVLVGAPVNQTIECAADWTCPTDLVATDDCGPATVACSPSFDLDDCGNGTITVSLVASDECGNDSEPYSYTITVLDQTAPEFDQEVEAEIVLACDAEVPAIPEVTATDNCDNPITVVYSEVITAGGGAPAAGSDRDCSAENPVVLPGQDEWAILLNGDEYTTSGASQFFNLKAAANWIVYQGMNDVETATLSGTVCAPGDPTSGFNFSVTLSNGLSWDAWQNEPFANDYKDDYDFAAAEMLYEDWRYFILDDTEAAMIGFGDYEGSVFDLSHAPTSKYFAFQEGQAANNRNEEFGIGGWFYFEGDLVYRDEVFTGVRGAGDFAMDLECCEEYQIIRTWTAEDCTGNISTLSQTVQFEAGATTEGNVIDQGQDDAEESNDGNKVSIENVTPNPSEDMSTISLRAESDQNVQVLILNAQGQVVKKIFDGMVPAGKMKKLQYNVNVLAEGMYYVCAVGIENTDLAKLLVSK